MGVLWKEHFHSVVSFSHFASLENAFAKIWLREENRSMTMITVRESSHASSFLAYKVVLV